MKTSNKVLSLFLVKKKKVKPKEEKTSEPNLEQSEEILEMIPRNRQSTLTSENIFFGDASFQEFFQRMFI